MSEHSPGYIRDLLRSAAGPPPSASVDFADVLGRARRHQRRRAVRLAVATLSATLVIALPALLPDSGATVVDTAGEARQSRSERGGGPGSSFGQTPPLGPGRAGDRLNDPLRFPPPQPTPTTSPRFVTTGPGPLVAYTMPDGIFVSGLDGANRRKVVGGAVAPAWSPDGSRLAVAQQVSPGIRRLAIVDLATGGIRVLRDPRGRTSGFSVDSPVWSPDGARIAFVQRYCRTGGADGSCNPDAPLETDLNGTHWSEIRSIGVAERDEALLVSEVGMYSESPSFSPDGSRFTYATAPSLPGGEWDVMTASSDGSNRRNLTGDPFASFGSAWDPAWSPDGRWIAFTGDYHGGGFSCGSNTWRIMTLSPDGRAGAGGTAADACDSEAAWGPSSQYLVFTRRIRADRSVGELHHLSTGSNIDRGMTQGSQPAVQPRLSSS